MLELYDEDHLRSINVNRDEVETVKQEGDAFSWETKRMTIFEQNIWVADMPPYII